MHFPYVDDPRFRLLLAPLGVRRHLDGVTVEGDEVQATFGFLSVTTTIENIAVAEATGPYRWWRAVGPHLSLADRGLTFGTTDRGGVCLGFTTPVHRVIGPWDHPGLTVTVADPARLVELVGARR